MRDTDPPPPALATARAGYPASHARTSSTDDSGPRSVRGDNGIGWAAQDDEDAARKLDRATVVKTALCV